MSASVPGAKRERCLEGHEPTKDRTARACINPCPTQDSSKWQQGLHAVNQTSDNPVRRSTNEPLSAEKEDTTAQTIDWVNAIV